MQSKDNKKIPKKAELEKIEWLEKIEKDIVQNPTPKQIKEIEEIQKRIDRFENPLIPDNRQKAIEYNRKGREQSNFFQNYVKAIENYSIAIELNPNYYQAYRNRSIAYESIGKYEEALSDAEKAVLIMRTGPNYEQRGDIYCRLGYYSAAIKDYEIAIDYYNRTNTVTWDDGRESINVSSNEIKERVLNKLKCAKEQRSCF